MTSNITIAINIEIISSLIIDDMEFFLLKIYFYFLVVALGLVTTAKPSLPDTSGTHRKADNLAA